MASTGVVSLLVGLALCFFGAWSLRLTGLLTGFALAESLADALGASLLVALIVGAAGAIAGLLLLVFALRSSLWVLGGLAGGVIAVRIYRQFFMGEGSPLLVLLVVLAVGVICGFLVDHYRRPLLAVVTAVGGAGVALAALSHLWPGALGFLREPDTTVQAVIGNAAWIALAIAGWGAQRRRIRKDVTH